MHPPLTWYAQVAPASPSNTRGSNNQVETAPNTHEWPLKRHRLGSRSKKYYTCVHVQTFCFSIQNYVYAHPNMQKFLPPAWRSLLGLQERRSGGLSISFLVVPSRLSLGKDSGERMAGPCYLLTHEHPRNNFNCRGSMHGIKNVIYIYIYIYI